MSAALRGVVAQQVDGLADFVERVGDRAAGLGNAASDELGSIVLRQQRRAVEDFGSMRGGHGVPQGLIPARGLERGGGRCRIGIVDVADDARLVGGVAPFSTLPDALHAGDSGNRDPRARRGRRELGGERDAVAVVREVTTA